MTVTVTAYYYEQCPNAHLGPLASQSLTVCSTPGIVFSHTKHFVAACQSCDVQSWQAFFLRFCVYLHRFLCVPPVETGQQEPVLFSK